MPYLWQSTTANVIRKKRYDRIEVVAWKYIDNIYKQCGVENHLIDIRVNRCNFIWSNKAFPASIYAKQTEARPQICDMMDAAHDAITKLNLAAAELCQIASPAQQQEYDKQINELRRLINSMGQFYLRITKK